MRGPILTRCNEGHLGCAARFLVCFRRDRRKLGSKRAELCTVAASAGQADVCIATAGVVGADRMVPAQARRSGGRWGRSGRLGLFLRQCLAIALERSEGELLVENFLVLLGPGSS